ITSNKFHSAYGGPLSKLKDTLLDIERRANGDKIAVHCVNEEGSPGYVRLFSDMIRQAEKDHVLSQEVSSVFFAPRFKSIPFVESLVEELILAADRLQNR